MMRRTWQARTPMNLCSRGCLPSRSATIHTTDPARGQSRDTVPQPRTQPHFQEVTQDRKSGKEQLRVQETEPPGQGMWGSAGGWEGDRKEVAPGCGCQERGTWQKTAYDDSWGNQKLLRTVLELTQRRAGPKSSPRVWVWRPHHCSFCCPPGTGNLWPCGGPGLSSRQRVRTK